MPTYVLIHFLVEVGGATYALDMKAVLLVPSLIVVSLKKMASYANVCTYTFFWLWWWWGGVGGRGNRSEGFHI